MFGLMDIIITERLILRSPQEDDLRELHEHVLCDPDVMKMAFAGLAFSFEQSAEFFTTKLDYEQSGRKPGVLVERQTQAVIGLAGLMACDALKAPDYELGFILRRSAWGCGYASEIGRGQIAYAFGSLQLNRVLALVAPQNAASSTVLKKIGLSFHSVTQNHERGERHVYTLSQAQPSAKA